jgi:uncharacterized repeat protein (TIGR01451 family)
MGNSHVNAPRSSSGSLRHLTCLAILAAALAAPHDAAAQGVIPKTPTGPQVVPIGMGFQVPAGEEIIWRITWPPIPAPVTFVDTPQHRECEPGQTSSDGNAGNTMESAPQTALVMEDLDGDGDCDEAVVTAPMGTAITCDFANQRLEIANIPAFTATTIEFRTHVDEATAPGLQVCNWGHLRNPLNGNLLQDTGPPGGLVPGCSCVTITPPSNFDFEATKTFSVDGAPPLVPGEPSPTIIFDITATNTGTDDITGASLQDNLGRDLEWVDIVDCPTTSMGMPLTCTIVSPSQLTATGYFLAAGESLTVRARARVTCDAATDDDTGEVCNQGQFTTMGQMFATDDPREPGLSDPTCVPVVFSNLTESEKRYDSFTDDNANGILDAGERVRFRIRARNTGRLMARRVNITDDLSTSACFDLRTIVPENGGMEAGGVIQWEVGDLAATFGTADVFFSVVLAVDAMCCNQAELQSEERIACGLGTIPTDDPTTTTVPGDATCISPGPQPNLVVTKEWCQEPMPPTGCDPSTPPALNDVIRWTVTITNTGAGAATSAEFLDDLNDFPCNFGFNGNVDCTTTDGSDCGRNMSTPFMMGFPPNFGTVRWIDVGGANGIQPGETITLSWTDEINGSVQGCCNQGFVTYAERTTPVPTDDPLTPGLVDDQSCLILTTAQYQGRLQKTLELVDVNGSGFIAPGDQVRYTLVFTNTGNDPLTNIVITDPESPTTCTRFDNVNVSIEPPGAGGNTSSGGNVQVTIPGPIPPAATVTIVFTADIQLVGSCCNQASWTSMEAPGPFLSDLDPDNLTPDEETCFTAVDEPVQDLQLDIVKTSDAMGCLDPGTTVSFTVTVRNVGTDPVDTWSWQDVLDAGFTNVTVDPPATLAGSTVSFTAGAGDTLNAGDSRTYTYRAAIPCTAAGALSNTADLTYRTPTGDVTDSSTAGATWGSPDLSAGTAKTMTFDDADGSGHVDVGERVTYTITVTNTGSCAARDVRVTDTLDARFDEASVQFLPGDAGTVVGSTITWTSADVPELASIPPSTTVDLVFSLLVDPATPEGVDISNAFTVDVLGHAAGNCTPPVFPTTYNVGVAPTDLVPWGEIVPPMRQMDMLRNAAYPGETLAMIFAAGASNDDVCGFTSLDEAGDVCATCLPRGTDIEALLGAGITAPGDATVGGARLVFYEAAEHCLASEGGADLRICVKKSGADVVITGTATPATCP